MVVASWIARARRLARAALLATAVASALACKGNDPLLAESAEPLLHVVIGLEVPAPGPHSLEALVLTAGTPLAPRYREIERFEMRRVHDGARLDWQTHQRSGELETSLDLITFEGAGNVELPWTGSDGRLGLQDLRPGDEFTLDVSTEGRTLTGSVTLPGLPVPVYRNDQGVEVISWAPVPGAANYVLIADTDAPTSSRVTLDTSYVLRRDASPIRPVPDEPVFTLIALDANLNRFIGDSLLARAGISGGYGILGAFVQVSIPIPDVP